MRSEMYVYLIDVLGIIYMIYINILYAYINISRKSLTTQTMHIFIILYTKYVYPYKRNVFFYIFNILLNNFVKVYIYIYIYYI